MFEYEREENKGIMLKEMRNNNWETDVDENSSYEEIEEAYDEMLEEYDAAEDAMYPNGRDYDAEDFD